MNQLPSILFRSAFAGQFHVLPTSPALQSLVDSWKRAFPESIVNPDIDFEDWVEPASLLHAAMNQSPNRVAIVQGDHSARFLNGKPLAVGSPAVFIGQWHKADGTKTGVPAAYDLMGAMDSIQRAERYFLLNAFKIYAGRPVVTCGVAEYEDDAVERNVWEELAAMSQQGISRAFVKVSRNKYAIYRLDLPPNASPEAIKDHVIATEDALAWASVHLAGDPNAFMVQPFVFMEHEYRIIVVDHEPVVGAGCIESFTPLDNAGAAWDDKTQQVRSSSCPIESSPKLVIAYRQFANKVTAAMREECPDCSHYTLDVALINGQPAVVELNPLQNFGLYAMKCDDLIEALTRSAQRRSAGCG